MAAETLLPRFIRKDFPELGPDVWVQIRNPVRLPDAALWPRDAKKVPVVEGGVTVGEKDDADDRALALAETVCALVKDWHVYDETADGEVEIPVSDCNPDTLDRRVSRLIWKWLLDEHKAAVVPPPVSQEPTSSIPGSDL